MVWVLRLNDMRTSKVEYLEGVAFGPDEDALVRLIKREMVEPYQDGKWRKVFRKGGPLEWYNGPTMGSFEDVGTREEHMERAGEDWDAYFTDLWEAD